MIKQSGFITKDSFGLTTASKFATLSSVLQTSKNSLTDNKIIGRNYIDLLITMINFFISQVQPEQNTADTSDTF